MQRRRAVPPGRRPTCARCSVPLHSRYSEYMASHGVPHTHQFAPVPAGDELEIDISKSPTAGRKYPPTFPVLFEDLFWLGDFMLDFASHSIYGINDISLVAFVDQHFTCYSDPICTDCLLAVLSLLFGCTLFAKQNETIL